MTDQPARLRPAGPDDAMLIARLHVTAWRHVYDTLATPEAMERLDLANRLGSWRVTLAESGPGQGALIAEIKGVAVGFARWCAASQAALEPGGEIKHIFLLPEHSGKGIGRQLFAVARDELAAAGHTEMAAAVVAGNVAALKFYAALGGRRAGSFTDAGPIWKSRNHIFRWTLSKPAGRA